MIERNPNGTSGSNSDKPIASGAMPNTDSKELKEMLQNLSIPNLIVQAEPKSISTGHLPEEKIDEIMSLFQKEVEKAEQSGFFSGYAMAGGEAYDCQDDWETHLTHIKQEGENV